jgi:hypothetical protein
MFGGSINFLKKDFFMEINKEWHLAHRMPKNPSLEQRIAWHIEHAKNCKCVGIPAKLQKEIDKRGVKSE